MSKISADMNSMMVALRRSKELGCSSAHRDSNGGWQPCKSASELKRVSGIKKRPIADNVRIRERKGSNKLNRQWEPLGQRGVVAIATLEGGGLVSGAVGKALKPGDLEVYDNIDTARQRARQLGCIGVARRYTATGREVWTPCTNMSDLNRLAGLTSLGRRRQQQVQERVLTEAYERHIKKQKRKKKSHSPSEFKTKKLSGRLGGGLRVPPKGMVFVDISGAIDADRDGIINEGKPTERPIIPARMIRESVASALPLPELSSSMPLESVDLDKQRTPSVSRSTDRKKISGKAVSQRSREEISGRLSSEDQQFMQRLSRNPGYASEVPDRILMAMPPEFHQRVRQQNVKAELAGFRSMSTTKPSGGRAMSDLIMGRIDEEEFGKTEPTMYFIGGTMGAGKSTFVSSHSELSNIPTLDKSAHIDPDEIKTALPGYNGGAGASAVHQQSRVITDKILDRALNSGVDVVIQGTGKRNEHLRYARDKKYRTVGHYVWVPSDMSADRIRERTRSGGTRVDPGLGPLIASELRDLTHRQVTSDLLDEFYLWDTTQDPPRLIASLDGDGNYEILDDDVFYDFFGRYGGDRVKAHWGAIAKERGSDGIRSRVIERGEITPTQFGETLQPRMTASGFTKENPMKRTDIDGLDLRRAEISRIHIAEGADMRGIVAPHMEAESISAPGVNFTSSNLFGANLSRANLHRAKFGSRQSGERPADLRYAHLTYIQAFGANFSGVSFNGANLHGANLRQASFQNADLRGANLEQADLRGANLLNAAIDDESLSKARVDNTTILPDGSRGKDSSIPGTGAAGLGRPIPRRSIPLSVKTDDDAQLLANEQSGQFVVFDGADSDLSGLSLDRRDLRGSSISNLIASGSELTGADLSNSKLNSVDLSGSMLEGAKAKLANLTNINLSGIRGSRANFKGSTMRRVNLSGSDLREINFENVVAADEIDLRGADLTGAHLAGADLSRALVDELTKFSGARVDQRTKLPIGINPKTLGAPQRSRASRDFSDYLLAEVIEDARYSQVKPSGEPLKSIGQTDQPDFIRGEIITSALARLLARDFHEFGPQLTAKDHRNINSRIMLAKEMHDKAEMMRARAAAVEQLDEMDSLSQAEKQSYLNDASFGSLADNLMRLRMAIEAEHPSSLQDLNAMTSFTNERQEKLAASSNGRSLLDELYSQLNRGVSVPESKRTRIKMSFNSKLARASASDGLSPDGMRSSSRLEDMYEATTNALIEALEKADGDRWERPWAANFGLPRNAKTGVSYRGSNIFWLWAAEWSSGYDMPVWATYKQWQDMGAQVRKGEKGTSAMKMIVAQSKDERLNPDGTPQSSGRLVPRGFTLFNINQVDGIEKSQFEVQELSETERVQRMETIVSELNLPVVFWDRNRAYFSPSDDHINMPPFGAFKTSRGYYATLAHESIHWTGHSSRLDRPGIMTSRFGTPQYAYEELVAEIGSTLFMALMGLEIEPQQDHAQYIKSWLSLLKSDPDALKRAINDAQKAIDFIIERSPTLKRDLRSNEPDGDQFGEVNVPDADTAEVADIANLAARSTSRDGRLSESGNMSLYFGKANPEPIPLETLASMTEAKLASLITEDRMLNMSAKDLARKYSLSEPEVLMYVRRYLEMLDSGDMVDEPLVNSRLPIRRNGQIQRIAISELEIAEAESALQYIRKNIVRAKNTRELRKQKSLEEQLLARLANLGKSSQ